MFSRCWGVPCWGRTWVTFYLDITIRVWEILPLIKGKCQDFDFKVKMVTVPDINMRTFLLLPFVWFSGSFTSGCVYGTVQGSAFPSGILPVTQESFQDNFNNMQFLYYILNIDPNSSKRSNSMSLLFPLTVHNH